MRALLCCCFALTASAAELQLWNTTEFKVFEKGKTSVNAAGMLRLRDGLSDAYDNRLGAAVRTKVTPRIAVWGGYLKRWTEGRHENRLFAGSSVELAARPLRLEWTPTYERHLVPSADFNRYKQKLEAEWTRTRLSPVLWHEFSLRNEGLVRVRTWAGGRLRLASGVTIDAGYQFESFKSGTAWAPRHSIRTTVSLARLPALIQ